MSETREVCPSCGGASLYAPESFGGCETCDSTGEVAPLAERIAHAVLASWPADSWPSVAYLAAFIRPLLPRRPSHD